jgi:hypothetical protein
MFNGLLYYSLLLHAYCSYSFFHHSPEPTLAPCRHPFVITTYFPLKNNSQFPLSLPDVQAALGFVDRLVRNFGINGYYLIWCSSMGKHVAALVSACMRRGRGGERYVVFSTRKDRADSTRQPIIYLLTNGTWNPETNALALS